MLNENRRLSLKPAISLSINAINEFPRRFESFFNDHFSFRNDLIHYYNLLKVKTMAISPSKSVLLGKNGWMYFKGCGAVLDYCSLQKFSSFELEQLRLNIEAKQNWLTKKGIAYLFVVAPNKLSIYPEFLPDEIKHLKGETRLDQLVEYMKKYSDVEILDLRKRLLTAKNKYRVFHLTDTHWNDIGAYFAYRKIIESTDKILDGYKLIPKKISDFQVRSVIGKGGDLANFIGLKEVMQEDRIRLYPGFSRCAKKIELPSYLNRKWNLKPFAMECLQARGKAVIFHDSFTVALVPFLAEHFQRSVYIWKTSPDSDLLNQVIEIEHPDIVVEEIVERLLGTMKTDQKFG